MKLRPALLPVAALLLGSGCTSPREHYYTLVPEGSRAGPTATAPTHFVVVEPAAVPEAEDRPQLVVAVAAQQQAVLEQERWIEPLPEDLQRALAGQLAASLGDTAVLLAGDHGADATARRLYVQVRRFELSIDHGVRLEAHWLIQGPDKVTLREGDFAQARPAPQRAYAALVQAQSACVGALGEQVAAALRALP